MSNSDLKKLQRDIDGLLEANQLDWLKLATQPMKGAARGEVRKKIAARTVNLSELLQSKWALERSQPEPK